MRGLQRIAAGDVSDVCKGRASSGATDGHSLIDFSIPENSMGKARHPLDVRGSGAFDVF